MQEFKVHVLGVGQASTPSCAGWHSGCCLVDLRLLYAGVRV